MQCEELLLFIWALFLPGSIFSSASHGQLIAQILQSRSFILQPCRRDKATCVGINATGFQVPKDKLWNFKNWLEILSGKYNTWWVGMFWICNSGLTWPMSMPLSSSSLRKLVWRVQQNGAYIQMWVPRILSHARTCSAFGKWSFVSTDKINIMRLHWPVTHRELQDSCILRVAHKLKYASIKCSSFTIKAQNSTSQMTIHKQFVNTYAQMLNDLLLKKLKNRRSK